LEIGPRGLRASTLLLGTIFLEWSKVVEVSCDGSNRFMRIHKGDGTHVTVNTLFVKWGTDQCRDLAATANLFIPGRRDK
jgi:hypothetical protein